MNNPRLGLAAFGATVAYFAYGFVVFGALPILRNEYAKYPAVYRTPESMKGVMPFGMLAIFVSIAVLVVIYSLAYQGGSSLVEGIRFGALIGVFSVSAFVIHNHVNLNVGLALTVGQAIAYFIEWTIVGAVIGLLYKPGA